MTHFKLTGCIYGHHQQPQTQ